LSDGLTGGLSLGEIAIWGLYVGYLPPSKSDLADTRAAFVR
jgi:hypothetical protein